MNAKDIKAQGVTFENMTFLNRIPTVEQGQMNEKQSITFRTTVATPVVSFENAELQRSSWRNTELLQVDKEGNVLETATPALFFAGANISGANFSEALYRGETLSSRFVRALEANSFDSEVMQDLSTIFLGAKYDTNNPPKLLERDVSEEQWKQVVTIFKKRNKINAN